jgi:molecular chaperone GrpE
MADKLLWSNKIQTQMQQEQDNELQNETIQPTGEAQDTVNEDVLDNHTESDHAQSSNTDAHQEEQDRLGKVSLELNDMKDKYLRLYADFENYRKRVAKEKLDMYKTANEALIKSLLTVLDNFERAKKSLPEVSDEIKPHLDGINLIYESLHKTLTGFGLKEIPTSQGDAFNTDLHEAVTQIPMEGLSGKVVDTIEKGYYLEDKVIRFVKVVVGA